MVQFRLWQHDGQLVRVCTGKHFVNGISLKMGKYEKNDFFLLARVVAAPRITATMIVGQPPLQLFAVARLQSLVLDQIQQPLRDAHDNVQWRWHNVACRYVHQWGCNHRSSFDNCILLHFLECSLSFRSWSKLAQSPMTHDARVRCCTPLVAEESRDQLQIGAKKAVSKIVFKFLWNPYNSTDAMIMSPSADSKLTLVMSRNWFRTGFRRRSRFGLLSSPL